MANATAGGSTALATTPKTHCLYDEIVPLGDLKPHPKNRNSHPDDQITRLAAILAFQGWRYPIKVSKRTGFVTSGHGRILAAKENGWPSAPVNFQDYDSEEQEYADVQADNAIASWSELDLSGINSDLGDLGPDFNLDLLGIKDFVLEPADKLPDGDPDEVPEPPVEPKTKLGDVYRLGRHRLMCGDATAITDVERLMAGAKADMVFTDPPYGISFQSAWRTESERFDELKNDDTVLTEWVNCLPIVSRGWVFVWTTWRVLTKWIEATAPIGDLTNVVIWDKGGGGIGDLKKTLSTDYEMALVFNRGAELFGPRIGSVWSVGKDRAVEYKHPTQKPVELAEMAFRSCAKYGASILDLFGGSGSTLIACEKTNRNCYMMELDPKYCDVIVARWEQYTGQKAELLKGDSSV